MCAPKCPWELVRNRASAIAMQTDLTAPCRAVRARIRACKRAFACPWEKCSAFYREHGTVKRLSLRNPSHKSCVTGARSLEHVQETYARHRAILIITAISRERADSMLDKTQSMRSDPTIISRHACVQLRTPSEHVEHAPNIRIHICTVYVCRAVRCACTCTIPANIYIHFCFRQPRFAVAVARLLHLVDFVAAIEVDLINQQRACVAFTSS